jgi:hypothetical protein
MLLPKTPITNNFDVVRTADPGGTGLSSAAPGYDLTRGALGHPQLIMPLPGGGDLFFEADVYAPAAEPMYIYINCPLCMTHDRTIQLRIRGDAKSFSYEVDQVPRPFPGWNAQRMREEISKVFAEQGRPLPPGLGGTLTIADPIRCTFEADPSLRRSVDPLCPWRVRIENNVVRLV